MRTSKDDQQRTRRSILDAAAQIIAAQGFRSATMHEIAARANVGDATIYKYFPSKEDLVFGYFELRTEDLINRLRAIEGFAQLSFREQLHVLFETQFELFDADRAFIRTAYESAFLTNWIATASRARASRDRFVTVVADLVSAATEVGEFAALPFPALFPTLVWEFNVAATYYWLEDTSPNYTKTTEMLDRSLALLEAVLKSNVLSRLGDLVQFLIREHILSKIQPIASVATNAAPKRAFMPADEPPPARRTRSAAKQRKTS